MGKNQWLGLALSLGGFAITFFLQQQMPGTGILLAVAAACLVSTFFLVRKLPARTAYCDTFSSLSQWMIVSLAGGLLLVVGNGYALLTGCFQISKLVAISGLVAGVAMMAISMGRFQGNMLSFLIHILPCLSLVVKLIVEFRQWSVDPTIMDYLFRQLAVIAAMIANLHIAGYCFGLGKRRTAAFCTIVAVFCSGAAMVGVSLSQALVTAGMAIWMIANAGQILED